MKSVIIEGWRFTLVNQDTKKAKQMLERYDDYEGITLRDVYGHHSWAKESSFETISRFCYNTVKGWALVITSHCTCFYTCAFMLTYQDKDYLAYITPSHNYLIPMED